VIEKTNTFLLSAVTVGDFAPLRAHLEYFRSGCRRAKRTASRWEPTNISSANADHRHQLDNAPTIDLWFAVSRADCRNSRYNNN